MQIGTDFDVRHHFEFSDQFDESRGSRRSEHGPQYSDKRLGVARRADEEATQSNSGCQLLHAAPPPIIGLCQRGMRAVVKSGSGQVKR